MGVRRRSMGNRGQNVKKGKIQGTVGRFNGNKYVNIHKIGSH